MFVESTIQPVSVLAGFSSILFDIEVRWSVSYRHLPIYLGARWDVGRSQARPGIVGGEIGIDRKGQRLPQNPPGSYPSKTRRSLHLGSVIRTKSVESPAAQHRRAACLSRRYYRPFVPPSREAYLDIFRALSSYLPTYFFLPSAVHVVMLSLTCSRR